MRSKSGDLFFRCGVDLRTVENQEGRRDENPCETDVWYRRSCSGIVVWNLVQPGLWRCALVRRKNPKRRRVLEPPIPYGRGMRPERGCR